jgi:hypothetical protein
VGHPDAEPAGDGGVSTLQGPFDWPDATVVGGDAVDVVARVKEESDVPLRPHGSLSLNRALMAAGLVDRVQVTLFPVITGQTGAHPIFQGAADFDLELLESRTLDDNIHELVTALPCTPEGPPLPPPRQPGPTARGSSGRSHHRGRAVRRR